MNHPLVIAHRGNSSSAPENTLTAIREAIDLGTDCVEVDVRCTKDCVPILIHDPAVGRLTGDSGTVSDLTFEEIMSLHVEKDGRRGERIPTFEEALLEVKEKTRLVAEMKVDCTDQVLDLVRKHKIDHGLCFAGFRIEMLQKIYRAMPSFDVAWILTAPQWIDTNSAKAIETALESEISMVMPPLPAVTHSSVCCAHEVGLKVWTWECDTPEQFELALAAGVDGIVTNSPGELMEFLAGRGRRGAAAGKTGGRDDGRTG